MIDTAVALLKLRNTVLGLQCLPFERRLARWKQDQIDRFFKMRLLFAHTYRKLVKEGSSYPRTSYWNYTVGYFVNKWPSGPPFDFLRDPVLCYNMVVTRGGTMMRQQLRYLETNMRHEVLRHLLLEDFVGRPLIQCEKYLTSHNSIHQLYHLVRFEKSRNISLDNFSSIIEWGPGYGNLAKIIMRMHPGCTYIGIDLPWLSCLQWIYLSTIFGEEKVNLVTSGQALQRHKINLIPLNFVRQLSLRAELFISTWALSESPKGWQDYVYDKEWFGANHLLLAYQLSKNFPDAGRVGKLAREQGARLEEFAFSKHNYYAFK